MNLNRTDITLLLDRSASMEDAKLSTIEATNEFINGQKKGVGECYLTLIQFAENYQPEYEEMDVHKSPKLTENNYQPTGYATALLNAIGLAITRTGERLKNMPENERPATVMFIIQTDGLENYSHIVDKERRFTKAKIAKMIEHQRIKYNWDIIFLGANIDAVKVGTSYGLPSYNTLSYNKDYTSQTFNRMGQNIMALREEKSLGNIDAKYKVSEEDRKESVNG